MHSHIVLVPIAVNVPGLQVCDVYDLHCGQLRLAARSLALQAIGKLWKQI